MPDASPPWQPLDTAPLDRPVDLRLERWVGDGDRLSTKHVHGASWIARTSIFHPVPHWSRVPSGWRATHWQPSTDLVANARHEARRKSA